MVGLHNPLNKVALVGWLVGWLVVGWLVGRAISWGFFGGIGLCNLLPKNHGLDPSGALGSLNHQFWLVGSLQKFQQAPGTYPRDPQPSVYDSESLSFGGERGCLGYAPGLCWA